MSMTLTPPQDATYVLLDPISASSGDRIWQLREQAGFTLGAIDWVVDWLAGFSPLEEWVAKPLGGDWGALDRGAVAWVNAGQAVAAVAANLNHLPSAIGDSWQGETAAAFDAAQAKVANALQPLPGACDSMAQLCTALADMAQAITEFVVMIAVALAEFIGEMLLALATVVGAPTIAVWIGKLSVNLARWVPQLTRMIDLFLTMAPKLATVIEKIQYVLGKVKILVELLMQLQRSMDSSLAQVAVATQQVDAATRELPRAARPGGGGGGGGV